MAILLEITVNSFFRSFVYTYGGEYFIQGDGGPIGARLTMCVARLVLQDWYESFRAILDQSKIGEHLRGLYVDDGRNVVDILPLGTRFVKESNHFEWNDEWKQHDLIENVSTRTLTEREMKEAMNSINSDLRFTTETEHRLRQPPVCQHFHSNSGLIKMVSGFHILKRVCSPKF